MAIDWKLVNEWIALILADFSLAMFVLAMIFFIFEWVIQTIRRRANSYESLFRWMAFFPLGVTGLYAFTMHAFFPEMSAAAIGWKTSPFQYEVAIANLAIGVLGVFSFRESYGFRLATVVAATFWLWGDGIGHIYQMATQSNFSSGNAGSWFWMDVIIPIVLMICIKRLKPAPYNVAESQPLELQS